MVCRIGLGPLRFRVFPRGSNTVGLSFGGADYKVCDPL